MDRNANKIVIVTQKSRLQELLYKYNTKAQAKFYIWSFLLSYIQWKLLIMEWIQWLLF